MNLPDSFSAPYRVTRHEYLDAKFVMVTLRCLGYPTESIQPAEWTFALKVPKADLLQWPIGEMVRLSVS